MLKYFTPCSYRKIFFLNTLTPSVERSFKEIKKMIGQTNTKHILVLGEEGIGKSYLYALLRRNLDSHDHYFLSENRWGEDSFSKILEGTRRNRDNSPIKIFIPDLLYYFETLGIKGQEDMWKELRDESIQLIAFSRYPPFALQKNPALKEKFKEISLERMNKDESYDFFLKVAENCGSAYDKISNNEELCKPVIEILGGNPRFLVMFFDSLCKHLDMDKKADLSSTTLADALLELTDRLAQHFTERVHSLSPLKQKIIYTIAAAGEAVPAIDIARLLNREDNQTITSQIAKLKMLDFLELAGKRGTYSFYYLKDSMMQLYYDMCEKGEDFFNYLKNPGSDTTTRRKLEKVRDDYRLHEEAIYRLTKAERILYASKYPDSVEDRKDNK